jgi:hypothetical protein
MDRLIDEIAPSCAITLIRAPTINRFLMPCRGLIAISKISPLASQRVLNLGRLIETAPPVRIKLHAKEKNRVSQQSPISIYRTKVDPLETL